MYLNFAENHFSYKINARWRSILFTVCAILALCGTIAEVVIYLIDAQKGSFFIPNDEYLFRFLYLPSSLNIITLLICGIITRHPKTSDTVRNYATCGLIYFLCANTEAIHYVYAPLLCLPCIAIFMSVLFVDKRLTLVITLASFGSLGFAAYMSAVELRRDDPQLATDIGLAVIITILAYVGVRLVSAFTIQQREYILQSMKRQTELIEKLKIDPLTKLYNRAALREKLEQIENSANKDCRGCIMIIDLDFFKRINDTYGHTCGDEVLTGFAKLSRSFAGDEISFYRYGGEEFLVVFESFDVSGALKTAEELKSRFEELEFSFRKKKPITFSGGISVCDDSCSDEWIARADEALYISKDNGRNRITVWSGENKSE